MPDSKHWRASRCGAEEIKRSWLSIEHIEPSPVKDIYTVISRRAWVTSAKTAITFSPGACFSERQRCGEYNGAGGTERCQGFAAKTKSIEYKSPNEKYRLACLQILPAVFVRNCITICNPTRCRDLNQIPCLSACRSELRGAGNMAKIWCAAKPNDALDAQWARHPLFRKDDLTRPASIYQISFPGGFNYSASGYANHGTLSGKPQLFTGWMSPENLVTAWASHKSDFSRLQEVFMKSDYWQR